MWWNLCVLILFLKWSYIDADCNIIDRREWNGVTPQQTADAPRPANLVIVIHTETPWCRTTGECKNIIKSIQINTINSKNFDDIGYAFIIGGDGQVYEGVGWLRLGYHTLGYDRTAIGIAFIGNYSRDTPTGPQLDAFETLLKCGVKLGHLTPDYRIIAQRQLILSESPGNSLYQEIKKWPQWLDNINKIAESRSLTVTKYAEDIGFYDSRSGLLNISGLPNQIYEAVSNGDYNEAVDLSLILDTFGTGKELTELVNKLLLNRVSSTMEYAYRLWDNRRQKIILKHFPIEFQMILNEESFKIENRLDTQALKTDANVDKDGDRNVWGDSKERFSNRMNWKIFPIWEENRLYFKIINVGHQMYLKMGAGENSSGDRNVYASTGSDTPRHQWYLRPMKHDHEVLFFIYNRQYGHILKLAREVDSAGDRLLLGQKKSSEDPNIFGWRIFH